MSDFPNGGARMHRTAFTLSMIMLSACVSGNSPNVSGGTIPGDIPSFLAADAACRTVRKYAVLRYLDWEHRTVTYDCLEF